MDFQLILYIIIVIVWLILDNYRRIKKKQEQTSRKYNSQPAPEQSEKPYTTLEDILREFGMEEEPEIIVEQKPKPTSQRKPKSQPKQKSAGYDTYESTANYESSINKDYKFSSETFIKDYKPLNVQSGDIKESEIKDMAVTGKRAAIDFDLRKAVIWSEILKRPYA